MRCLITCGVTAVLSSLATWMFAIAVYAPSDRDFLQATTAAYFRAMPHRDLNAIASYDDCHLTPPDDRDVEIGIAMVGLCRAESATTIYYYAQSMSPTGGFVYSDFSDVPKP